MIVGVVVAAISSAGGYVAGRHVSDVRVVNPGVLAAAPVPAVLRKDTSPLRPGDASAFGNLYVSLQVKQSDEHDAWRSNATIGVGDRAAWLAQVSSVGPRNVEHVMVSVNLAPHFRVVPGSVRYVDSAQDVVQKNAPLFTTGGLDLGTWKPGGGFYVRFETQALGDFKGCSASVRTDLVVSGREVAPARQFLDAADVTIRKPGCTG